MPEQQPPSDAAKELANPFKNPPYAGWRYRMPPNMPNKRGCTACILNIRGIVFNRRG